MKTCIFEPSRPGYCQCVNCGLEYKSFDACNTHVYYPCGLQKPSMASQKKEPMASQKKERGGAGTELKRLLSKFSINAKGACKCNQRASIMDYEGPDWCEAHIDVITGWLREEAKARHLPFVELAAKILIRRAIRNARRKITQ